MKSILTGKKVDKSVVAAEADVIVTAVAMGFAGTRWHQNQPFSFDYEHPSPKDYEKWLRIDSGKDKTDNAETIFLNELQEFLNVLSAMTFVLEKKDPEIGPFLREAQSPEWTPGALITGRAGGQSLQPSERHRKMEGEWAKAFARRTTIDPEVLKLYQGRGAYTGMMDDPVSDNHLFISTKRVIDQDQNRWHPGSDDDYDKPYGLIRGKDKFRDINLSTKLSEGLGPLPKEKQELGKNERIGYIHGMSSAIVVSIDHGPWCTPYELATGEQTTKMASCFACTTYMYAAGFPPSSIHLGRGESWVPPSDHVISGEETGLYSYSPNVMASVLARWHTEINHYLKLGTAYLKHAIEQQKADQKALDEAEIKKKVINYVNPEYNEIVGDLDAALKKIVLIHEEGGNLFLDALTVHESDWRRIQRTLQPVCDHYANQAVKATEKAGDKTAQLERKLATGAILVA